MRRIMKLKNLLMAMTMCLVVAFVTSCGADNTPAGVTKQIIKYTSNGDYDSYVKLMNMSDEERQKAAEQMKKASASSGERDAVKDCEIVDEEIDEEAGIAHVRYKLTYKSGNEQDGEMTFEKVDGKWLMSERGR